MSPHTLELVPGGEEGTSMKHPVELMTNVESYEYFEYEKQHVLISVCHSLFAY